MRLADFQKRLSRWREKVRRFSPIQLRLSLTVQAAIESVDENTAVEITLFRDPVDGIWVAYPVGGPWAADPDNAPIVSGLDPTRVVAELLVTPAFPTPKEVRP
ncbi:hypothetical protein DAETH_28580 [Deinococcus aetherius]|uniref:Uncharacterized protein n=1 Tax=Deinococcus aetherius TaxID=200252 RepID=A0ABN6RJ61_9DEIO|nr:hypothetical protein [Deinococcus aetherius]BDP42889.1 hypothetical protein DAETH_28580 [Deinococcus aetherius]